jgi:CheY-like chemotaxis protein
VSPVELAPTIEAVVEGLRPAADAKNIQLRTALASQISPISGDPNRIQQIIWNLLSNAIKFTPEGGRVKVRLERIDSTDSSSQSPRRDSAGLVRAGMAGGQPAWIADSHAQITVSDTGQGIDPELLLHVFDRFRQSDSSITRRHGGLGLGLAIVRQLVELHGGAVTAESPVTREGCTFKVILPLPSVPHEPSAEEKTRPMIAGGTPTDQQPSLNGLRVLVVEDEQDSRELVAAVLIGRGAEVVSVESAIEALGELERRRFDVLVSDIGMPLMDGYALIAKYASFRPSAAEASRQRP